MNQYEPIWSKIWTFFLLMGYYWIYPIYHKVTNISNNHFMITLSDSLLYRHRHLSDLSAVDSCGFRFQRSPWWRPADGSWSFCINAANAPRLCLTMFCVGRGVITFGKRTSVALWASLTLWLFGSWRPRCLSLSLFPSLLGGRAGPRDTEGQSRRAKPGVPPANGQRRRPKGTRKGSKKTQRPKTEGKWDFKRAASLAGKGGQAQQEGL